MLSYLEKHPMMQQSLRHKTRYVIFISRTISKKISLLRSLLGSIYVQNVKFRSVEKKLLSFMDLNSTLGHPMLWYNGLTNRFARWWECHLNINAKDALYILYWARNAKNGNEWVSNDPESTCYISNLLLVQILSRHLSDWFWTTTLMGLPCATCS